VWADEQWDAVEQDARVAVDEAGTTLHTRPSTLGVPQMAAIVDPRRVLEHVVTNTYQLAPETLGPQLEAALSAGAIVEIPFRYRDGYDEDAMFVLKNEEGVFALIARPTGFAFLERTQLPLALDGGAAESDELSDDLDFSMM
jgi:hypothetical protein